MKINTRIDVSVTNIDETVTWTNGLGQPHYAVTVRVDWTEMSEGRGLQYKTGTGDTLDKAYIRAIVALFPENNLECT